MDDSSRDTANSTQCCNALREACQTSPIMSHWGRWRLMHGSNAHNEASIKELEFPSLRHEMFIQTSTSKGFPSALSVSRVYEKVKKHDSCSWTPKEIKSLAWTKWVTLCSCEGYTLPIMYHASLVFCREIIGEQKSKAGDRGGESMWARKEIGRTGTGLWEKNWYQEDLRRGVTLQ